MFLPLGPWRRRKVSNNSIRYIDNTRLMCTHRPSQKEELRAFLTASRCFSLLGIPYFPVFSRQVLCSTVGVVQRHRFSLVRREPRLRSRDGDERHHRPVTASAPDRRHWWRGRRWPKLRPNAIELMLLLAAAAAALPQPPPKRVPQYRCESSWLHVQYIIIYTY